MRFVASEKSIFDQNYYLELFSKYFPDLDQEQLSKLSQLDKLYTFWNEQINLISRKDMDNFQERHVLHSLAIAKFISFQKKTIVLDLGTGGGFQGIPLAIYFPQVEFHLTDSIGKKIKVAETIAKELGLTNVIAKTIRTENYALQCDFVVTRAVAKMDDLVRWTHRKIKKENKNTIANGIIALKGGDLTEELLSYKKQVQVVELKNYFDGEFFETKKLVYYHP